jgi:hypothetical protein
MEDSGYNSLMIGVYIFIFLIATTLTIYLFSSTITFADKAYEYGKASTGESVIETTVAPKYNTVTGAELLTYYYNYKSPDKYGTAITPIYDFQNINNININKTYTLIYEKANTGERPVIRVLDVTAELGTPTGGEVIESPDVKPSDPTITTYPYSAQNAILKVTPGQSVEFRADSSVNTSFATNSITKYYWEITYSSGPLDGRSKFTATTYGTSGELTTVQFGSALIFKDGTNIVSVTAYDSLGNASNTISKTIQVGYEDPTINSISEESNKVQNNGNINVNSSGSANLTFIADAVSNNRPGGYIQKYDWYVNDTLAQSGASERYNSNFAVGNYSLKLIVTDSIQGTAQSLFTFTVSTIPAPIITCSESAIITNHTLAITNSTKELTFNADNVDIQKKYGILKYVWKIDGTDHETYVPNGINLNYGLGDHLVKVYAVDAQGIVSSTSTLSFTLTEDFIPFEQEYTSNGSYYTVTLQPGKYIFETWGARGGNGSGGYGGYAAGQLNLTVARTFYIYVGSSAGYNGGGSSRLSYSIGGGATDIRLNNGAWNDITSLRSRIIVAGGGGGNGGYSAQSAGAIAGGLTGYIGGDHYGNPGTGGTQTYGGSAGRLYWYGATNGSFGIGGNAETASNTSAGAGGGGYYGGGGGSSDYSNYNDLDDSGGGGGSSFVSGYSGCNAINSSGVHTGQPNHYSGLTFINTTITAGSNLGDGKAKITRVR